MTLKLSSFLLASRSPTVTGRPRRASEGSGPWARSGISELLGFRGWLGILPSASTLKVATNKVTGEEGVKGVMAKDLKEFPLFFGLRVSRDIVNQVPEKENKSNGNCFVFTCLGGSGENITWALSLKLPVPIVSRSVKQIFGQGIWRIGWLRPEVG